MTTCFHKYTPPEGQTQVIARAQSISLIRCLFRLVKCKFTEPLYKSAWYTLLSLLIFSTYALSIKREGHNLKKKIKKIKKKGNIAVAAVVAFLCGYALKSAVLRYCGYRDSPRWDQQRTTRRDSNSGRRERSCIACPNHKAIGAAWHFFYLQFQMYISDFFLACCSSHRRKKVIVTFYLAILSLYLAVLREKKSWIARIVR